MMGRHSLFFSYTRWFLSSPVLGEREEETREGRGGERLREHTPPGTETQRQTKSTGRHLLLLEARAERKRRFHYKF